jgi:penicillin-insensitive murein endopeptidase
MLERAAHRVDRRYPGSILLVGDLSRREGGSIAGHLSHENGRDADVGFYYLDDRGRSIRTERLLPVRDSGTVPAPFNLRFDEARNWALIESFLTDSDVSIQSIFVAAGLERRLLSYARQHRTRRSLVSRAQSLLQQTGASAHDDHFHVRVALARPSGR